MKQLNTLRSKLDAGAAGHDGTGVVLTQACQVLEFCMERMNRRVRRIKSLSKNNPSWKGLVTRYSKWGASLKSTIHQVEEIQVKIAKETRVTLQSLQRVARQIGKCRHHMAGGGSKKSLKYQFEVTYAAHHKTEVEMQLSEEKAKLQQVHLDLRTVGRARKEEARDQSKKTPKDVAVVQRVQRLIQKQIQKYETEIAR